MEQTIKSIFKLGMDRDMHEALPMPEGVVLNIGAGKKLIANTIVLDWPEWDADKQPIPYEDESVDGIHCYHFLEHVEKPIDVLKEFQRVLKPGGLLQIVVPFYNAACFYQDLDHKHPFSEETWRNTFHTPYYDKKGKGWLLEVHLNIIIGIVERNICLMTQMVKKA